MTCQFQWKKPNLVEIAGVLGERASFDELIQKIQSDCWVDMRSISRVNSSGVRQWALSISQIKGKIHYINCSCPIVDQFSMVPEFLGAQNVVESFEARYACPQCQNVEIFILEVGKDIAPGLDDYTEAAPPRTCPKCNAAMEFDHSPEVYLDFLKTNG
jgi:Zn finger protein HypA/HybF involved in hydrogenase expression